MIPLLLACTGPEPYPAVDAAPEVVDVVRVVPSDGLPAEVIPRNANNNLDIEVHDGRLFFAFRTGRSHFASADVDLYVVSTTDQETWRFEGHFHRGTDLREPQLISWNGALYLYFAVLGDNALDFEPQGAMYTRYNSPGDWEEPTWYPDDTFIPWRIKRVDDELYMIGYSGGAGVYDLDAEPIEIRWLTSEDAVSWEAAVPGAEVVHSGGGSETDFVIQADGSLVAVIRNEAGDEDGFGSKICRAEPEDLGEWTCAADKRKYDSPLLVHNGNDIWLVARRNVTESGNYDLEMEELDPGDRYLHYQVAYWNAPKRCSLWRVDPDELAVNWVLDLPSRGDTCFPEALPWDPDSGRLRSDDAPGPWLLYNYTSPLDGPDVPWIEGQTGQTHIYRQLLRLGYL